MATDWEALDQAYDDGVAAFEAGKRVSQSPYDRSTVEGRILHAEWCVGYCAAEARVLRAPQRRSPRRYR